MKIATKILRWIWELPQCLLGVILTKCYNVRKTKSYNGISVYIGRFPGGISLGQIIISNELSWNYNTNFTREHEYGHTRQSLYLGPLYLLVVGFPSILWAAIHTPHSKRSYYSVYPENWADRLGGVPKR